MSNRSRIAVTALLAIFAMFVLAACVESTESPFATTTPVPAADAPGSSAGGSGGAVASGPDVANGESKFASLGCSGCHSTGTNKIIGPGLAGIGSEGDDFIRESIVDPAVVIADGYQDIMPKTFAGLNESDLADLVAYLKTLG